MTFLQLTDLDAADLALELFYAGDAETLDQAAALASDLSTPFFDFAECWDFDTACLAIAAGDAEAIGCANERSKALAPDCNQRDGGRCQACGNRKP